MRVLLLLVAVWAAPSAQAAGDDVLSSANWARQRGCRVSPAPAPFQVSLKLQKAARRVAAGAALRAALAEEGYAALESSELHLSGAVSPNDIVHALTANFCGTLADPNLREMGAQRRGSDLWILLAAPVAAPGPAEAVAVGRDILERVNSARAAGRRCGAKYFAPAAPLTLDAHLSQAALAHSREMARFGEFDHRGHDGSTPEVRVERAGYGAHRIVGENIAAGAMTPQEVTSGWLSSPAHCENIMDGRFSHMGIAYASNPRSAAGMYWTQEFAAPR